jgi:putative effector of murein hydrolase LrgA (UPF0299 family)
LASAFISTVTIILLVSRFSQFLRKILMWNIVAAIIGMIIVLAMVNEGANGVNFSLVPHCNPCEYNLHYK